MRGSPSALGTQPSGGDGGGDIKNCLTGAGSCKCWSAASIGVTGLNKSQFYFNGSYII